MRTRVLRHGVGPWALGVLFGAALVPAGAFAEEEVRIRIYEARSVEVSGAGLQLFDADLGAELKLPAGRRAVWLAFDDDGVRASVFDGGKRKAVATVRSILLQAQGTLKVDKGRYLGRIEVVVDEKARRVRVVNRLPLETYLLGIVGSEMPASWPLEALKAQSVAARTYAMYRRMMMRAAGRPYDMESTVLSQVYKGADHIRPRVIRAVEETRGQVLSFAHGLVEAMFHSTCGGHTRSAASVYGREVPYLKARRCEWCRGSSRYRWRVRVPMKKLTAALQARDLVKGAVQAVRRPKGSPVVEVATRGRRVSVPPRQVRAALGYGALYSGAFTARSRRGEVVFRGRGFGHGVGMCQWGARGMAAAGRSHVDILEHYYAGAAVRRIY